MRITVNLAAAVIEMGQALSTRNAWSASQNFEERTSEALESFPMPLRALGSSNNQDQERGI
jgi:hypothetical protein